MCYQLWYSPGDLYICKSRDRLDKSQIIFAYKYWYKIKYKISATTRCPVAHFFYYRQLDLCYNFQASIQPVNYTAVDEICHQDKAQLLQIDSVDKLSYVELITHKVYIAILSDPIVGNPQLVTLRWWVGSN